MNDLNAIREKKILELKQRMEEQKAEEYKKTMLSHVLTSGAYQRLCFVKQSHPSIAQQVEYAIIQYLQTNPNLKIDEEQLKNILYEISSTMKKDFKIIRK